MHRANFFRKYKRGRAVVDEVLGAVDAVVATPAPAPVVEAPITRAELEQLIAAAIAKALAPRAKKQTAKKKAARRG